METTGFTHPGPFPSTHLPSTPGQAAGWMRWGLGKQRLAHGSSSQRAFPAAASTPRVSAHLPGGYRQDRQTCTHWPQGERGARTLGMSLCTQAPGALGPAAARASHFLLHVVVELEFGLVGQLHGSVLQFLCNGCER